MERMCRETVVAYFKIVFQYFLEGTNFYERRQDNSFSARIELFIGLRLLHECVSMFRLCRVELNREIMKNVNKVK
jgi:hypothetical protein